MKLFSSYRNSIKVTFISLVALEIIFIKSMYSRNRRRRWTKSRVKADPVYSVHPDMKYHWTGQHSKAKKKVRHAPYGTHLGYEWEWDDRRKQFYRKGRAKQLPIQGPPNWDQTWKWWTDFDSDHKKAIPVDTQEVEVSPLPAHQMHLIKVNSHRYRDIHFDHMLGRGACATIWLVRCRERNSRGGQELWLACKVIKASSVNRVMLSMKEYMNNLLKDITIGQGLSHQNILPYLDVITIPDTKTHFPFIAMLILMPLCQGTLQDLIGMYEPNVVPNHICQHWMRQIADAIRYMHERDIVHLDIKPDNIMIQFANPWTRLKYRTVQSQWHTMRYMLGDFGSSRMYLHDEIQETDVAVGTVTFMAPELITHARHGIAVPTKPCDVYSLGASLLYCYLDTTLYQEFQSKMQLALIMKLLLYNPAMGAQVLPQFNVQFADLIFNMTNDDSNRRYTIHQVLQHSWLTSDRM